MRPEWKKYLQINAPRYTSYPSALFFDDLPASAYDAALGRIGQYEPVSYYIHVPFCAQLCWYCGCNMRVENRYERAAPYLDALLGEIRRVDERLAGHGRTTQLHFGGGTPNFLHPDDLIRILDEIEIRFGLTDETPVAMELDPRLCTPAKIKNLAQIGVTRMSLGVQDFDPFVQAAINRVQSYELIEGCVSAMREAGVGDVSFDLLYGLPNQTEAGFRQTLRKTLSLLPDRISLFGYAHLPGRIRHQRLIDENALPDKPLRARLAEIGAETLEAAGYRRIGFDHFALAHTSIARADAAGTLNRNFQGFTEDPAHAVIGFGPSAISTVHGVIAQNEKDIARYTNCVGEGRLPVVKGIEASPAQRLVGDWIHGLLCRHQACLAHYFGEVVTEEADAQRIMSSLAPFIEDGIVRIDGDRLTIEPEGRLFARAVAALFDPAVSQTPSRMSPAV